MRHRLPVLATIAFSALSALPACGVGPDSLSPAALESAATSHPTLGSIRARDRVVSFRGGPDGGPRFTVRDREGRLLAKDLTSDELAAFDPLLTSAVRGYATLLAD